MSFLTFTKEMLKKKLNFIKSESSHMALIFIVDFVQDFTL